MEKDYNSLLKEIAIPRISGENEERVVRNKIIKYLNQLGLCVKIDEFLFSKFPAEVFQRGILILFWTGSLSILLFFRNSIPAKILFYGLLFLSLSFLTRWSEKIEGIYNLFRKKSSANILAYPRHFSETKVLFVAHYDSKSQFLPLPVRIFFFLLFLLSTLVLPLSGSFWRPIFTIQTISLILLLLNISTNLSSGGIDNASGVLLLLMLAEKIRNGGVSFLFTGAEEMGLCGAVEFLKNYGNDLSKDAVIINVDGIGKGKNLIITTKFGIPPRRTSREVYKLIKKVGEKNGLRVKEGWLPLGAGLDHIPFATRGYESITIHLSSLKDAFFVHTPKDTPEEVDVNQVMKVSEVLYEILKEKI